MARLLCLIKVSVIIISSKIVLTVFISSDFISRRCSIKDWIFIFEHLHDTDNDRNNYNNQKGIALKTLIVFGDGDTFSVVI